MPDLGTYAGANGLEIRAYPRQTGAFVGGIVAVGLGGGFAFIGGMLALAGGVSERSGLVTAGAVTAGIGLVAIGPGVYLIATSGSRAEILSEGAPVAAVPRQLGVQTTF